jgi:hypothetical protein
MQLRNLGDGFTTILAALLLARYRTPASAQLRQLLLKETRISYALTVVRRKKMFQTGIDTNGRVLKALPSLPRLGEDDAPCPELRRHAERAACSRQDGSRRGKQELRSNQCDPKP